MTPGPQRPKPNSFLSRALLWATGQLGINAGAITRDEAPVPQGLRRVFNRPYLAENEPGAGDLASQPNFTPGLYDVELAQLIGQRFQDGIVHRQRHEAGWMEGLAAFNAIGWHFWDKAQGLVHYKERQPNQPHRVWASHPITRPRVRKLIARSKTSQVSWSHAPLSDMEEDRIASEEMSAAFDHIMRVNDWAGLKSEVEEGAITWCPHGIKVRIDPRARIQMPLWDIDEQGQVFVSAVQDARGPEVVLESFPILDCVIDPRARDWRKARWVIWETLMPLEEIRQRWPEMALFVSGNAGQNGSSASTQSRTRSVTGDLPPTSTPSGQRAGYVREMWEKPSELYERGRVVYECEGVILEQLPFPPGLNELPFVIVSYSKSLSSPFGTSAAQAAVPAQDHYNQMISAFLERAKERGKVIGRTGIGLKHDALRYGEAWEFIPVDLEGEQGGIGNALMYIQPPPLPTEAAAMLTQANTDLSEILEVQDVSRGVMPSGVTSGAAYRAMLEQDQSTSTLFTEECRVAYQRLGEILAPLAVLVYGSASRMLAISDQPLGPDGPEGDDPAQEAALLTMVLAQTGATPGQIVQLLADDEASTALSPGSGPKPRSAPQVFQALGVGRVQVVAEMRSVRTPDQRRADLMTLAQSGFFNEENLESTLLLFEEFGIQQSDRLYRRLVKMLRRRIAEKQAAQPDPAKLAEAEQKARAEGAIAVNAATERARLAREATLRQLEHANQLASEVVAGRALDTDPVAQEEAATSLEEVAASATAAFDAATQPEPAQALPDALAEEAPAAELIPPGGVEEAGESPLPQE